MTWSASWTSSPAVLKPRAFCADKGCNMNDRTFPRRTAALATITILSFVLAAETLAARTVFDGLDLSADDRLLFVARTGGDGSTRQSALFSASAASGALVQMTAFPERIDLLEGGRTLQIRNPFGALRVSVAGGLPSAVPGYPSFVKGAVVQGGRVEDASASPDGKWMLYVDPVSPAYGALSLIDTATGARTIVSDGVERPGRSFPASWSPDSRVFVYSREGKLYFRAVDSPLTPLIDERYRVIGEGRASSVRWGSSGDFFYLKGSTVYRVRVTELFARALYADFLEIGNVAGKIPLEFDPNFDAFWVAPDGASIILSKGGRNLFYYPLGVDDYGADSLGSFDAASLPYLMLPRSCSDVTLLWSPSGIVTVLATFPANDESKVKAYRLSTASESGSFGVLGFTLAENPRGAAAVLSPDGTRALVWGATGAAVYDYVNWKILSDLGSRNTQQALWIGNEDFIVADASTIERRSLSGRRSLICLSSSESHAFDEDGIRLLAKSNGVWFSTDGKKPWSEAADAKPRSASSFSPGYRAYLEAQNAGPYENIPMLRNVKGVGTSSLIVNGAVAYETVPSAGRDEAASPVFSHGRRYGRREVAIAFDLIDDAEGLPGILESLRRFGIRATFFLNGEFIRRHPAAAKEIEDSGHEAASLFFAPIDLTDARYRIDADFIKRGLARNEDEYFNATGGELSLLWHAPYYTASREIAAAAAEVGYATIGRDIDPLDWITRADARRSPGAYKSASRMVDDIFAAKAPGSIIPIRLGIPPSGRDDYLFNRLEVLVDALVRAGYEPVTVSTLMEHAR